MEYKMNHTYNTLTAVMAFGIMYWSADVIADGSGLFYIGTLIAGTVLLTIALRNSQEK
jgi:hypothetical protein